MSETIVVQGRECEFRKSRSPDHYGKWWIMGGDEVQRFKLTESGWRPTTGTAFVASDYFPTEAAAREFAKRHADQPAGEEASGCELPTHAGFWTHNGQMWMVTFSSGTPWASRPLEGDEEHGSVCGLNPMLSRGNWHPAPASELAELRAKVTAERAARERLVAEWRKCDHDGTEWEFGYQSGVLDAADQLAALDQVAAPKIDP